MRKMAESIQASDSIFCSICLDLLKSPVALHCGHSYCMDCVNGYWDQEDQNGVYSCPQCRHTFSPRPVLNKNTVLADLMVKMFVTAKKSTSPVKKDEAGPGDVECDFCTEKKLRAVKTCLVCLASYCATHVQPHYKSAAFIRHSLVDVSDSIQEKICSKHDKLLEVYCRSDDQCICLLCVMDEHKGHDTVSAAAERTEKQKQFCQKKQRYQQAIQEKEKQLRQLKVKMKSLQSCRDAAVDQNEKAYAEMVLMADKRRADVKEMIRSQEKAAVSRVEELVDQLEEEISELKKRRDELKQLSQMEDHIHFLLHCQPIFHYREPDASSDVNIHLHFDFVTKAVSDLRDKLETMANSIAEISKTIQADPDPRTRQEMAIYSCILSLDPNTAFENLLLSEENRKVTWIKKAQKYSDHPERFTKYDQVLCAEGLSGVCYWEFEWRGPRVEAAVCYKGAELEESGFGYTDQSWCISISKSGCTFWHDAVKTKISVPCSSTVGVYLNHNAGSLSFYSVSDSGEMMLLHRVQSKFSQSLYPGFMVSRGSSVKIITPK